MHNNSQNLLEPVPGSQIVTMTRTSGVQGARKNDTFAFSALSKGVGTSFLSWNGKNIILKQI